MNFPPMKRGAEHACDAKLAASHSGQFARGDVPRRPLDPSFVTN